MAEEDTMMQDMMAMMFVVMGIAIISQVLQVQAAPAANRNVTVTLKNPPDGDYWQLMLVDYDRTENRVVKELGMGDPAVFTDLPSNWRLPLKIDLKVFKADLEVYSIQSYTPYLWDFDKMDWGTEPDPTYKDVFLYAFGGYYFDFDIEAFTAA